MKKIILISVMLLFFSHMASNASELAVEPNKNLVSILNSIVLIREIDKLPLHIRIFEFQEYGECDGAPSTCPGKILYIAVSSYDEYPDQKLYKTLKAESWDIGQLIKYPHSEKKEDFAVLKIKKRELGNSSKEHSCLLKVNLYSAKIYECVVETSGQ